MNPNPDRRRDGVRYYIRAAAMLVVALIVVGVAAARHHVDPAAFAATNGGALQVVVPPGSPTAGQPLASGTSSTAFALQPPTGAACTGDSASDNYKIHSYMVPATVDPSTITYDAGGPTPQATGANLLLPLFSTSGTPYVNGLTAVKTSPTSGGLLTGLPVISFDALVGADVPVGTYNVGYACVLAPAGVAPTLDKWWTAQLTLGAGLGWTTGVPTTTTSSSTTSSTTTAPSTSSSTSTTTPPTSSSSSSTSSSTSSTSSTTSSTTSTTSSTTSTTTPASSTSSSTTTSSTPASSSSSSTSSTSSTTSTSTTSTSTTSTTSTTMPPSTSSSTSTTVERHHGNEGSSHQDDECGHRRFWHIQTTRWDVPCASPHHGPNPAPHPGARPGADRRIGKS